MKSDVALLHGEKSQLHSQIKKLESNQNKLLELNESLKKIIHDASSYSFSNMHSLMQKILDNFSKSIDSLTVQFNQRANSLLLLDEKIIAHTQTLAAAEYLSQCTK